jgi:hypothetical protein
MNLTLTWDLFIIVFFALVITYTFIIGKKEAVKIIISSYIGIVAVQGIGNVLGNATEFLNDYTGAVGVTVDAAALSWIKLGLFVAVIVFLAVRSGFDVVYSKEANAVVDAAITGIFGFATAGLLLSTLLAYASGLPILDFAAVQAAPLSPVVQQSQLMQLLLLHQDLWFALPAVVLIGAGFAHK